MARIVKLSPLFNDEQLGNDGLPLVGGLVNWYLAGTTTPTDTYTDSTGVTSQLNPIVLNARGEPANPIWLESGVTYKAILTDSLGNVLRTIDNITGVNDISTIPAITEWFLFTASVNYQSTTSFTISGDSTNIFTPRRRIKFIDSAGTGYATVTQSIYSVGITTVSVINDTIALDSGLSEVSYSVIDPKNSSIDAVVPVGTVIPLTGSTVPVGWLAIPTAITNISRTVYKSLFDVCGVLWGAGDGVTTFGMPFLAVGEVWTNGGTVGVHTNGTIPSHTHTYTFATNASFAVASGAGANVWTGQQTIATGAAGSGSTNLPAGQNTKYIVKY